MFGGIFVDVDNIARNGGFEIDYFVVKKLVEAQGVSIIRANAYLSVDEEREQDPGVAKGRRGFRNVLRRMSYHVVEKPVQKYEQPDGTITTKGNSDIDLAIDALLQSEGLQYVLIVSGDGDFVKLVNALQGRGKRVDVLSFDNTSGSLKREADYHFNGYLVPDLLPIEKGKYRGLLHHVSDKGFGFLMTYNGLKPSDVRDDIFVHISDVKELAGSVLGLQRLQNQILEFSLADTPDGRVKAVNVQRRTNG